MSSAISACEERQRLIPAALGRETADDFFYNLDLFNPFTCTFESASFAVSRGVVIGFGRYPARREHDLGGARVVPGLVDAHVHVESSLLVPTEYARLAARCGTTTAIADPHEIANVCGADGIEYMLAEAEKAAIDILVVLPSCVPATERDLGGAILDAPALGRFIGRHGVIGLAELMNVPGVLDGDPAVFAKLALSPVVDGHAPGRSGRELAAYVLSGVQSDHECTGLDEAREKLALGMYIMMREGSAERNVAALAPLANPRTAPRCCFATDDRDAAALFSEGQVDACIRTAVDHGVDLETALRMATLSACDRFGLADRGAVAPGRLADFCVLSPGGRFSVARTFKRGREILSGGPTERRGIGRPFRVALPTTESIAIRARGTARVIGLVPHQIVTEDLRYRIDAGCLPDVSRDIAKAVVCDRYRASGCGVGLVHGFGLTEGAIATSVAHDSHNIVAAGAEDAAILEAVRRVASMGGGMVAIGAGGSDALPLKCAGLMSLLPAEDVIERLHVLHDRVRACGGGPDAFMHLSFLPLTVIPSLRLTDRGLFDGVAWCDVPLFVETD